MQNSGFRSLGAAAAVALVVCAAPAAVELVAPADGATFQLLPDEQRTLIDLPTHDARVAWLKANRAANFTDKDAKWRTARPLRLSWRATDGENGPWKILLATTPDFADAKAYWAENQKAGHQGDSSQFAPDARAEKTDGGVVFTWTLPLANLEMGRTYWWRVYSNVKCSDWWHLSTMTNACPCGKGRRAVRSAAASFTTDFHPPRWIALEGRIRNIRDIGGWRTADGGRVRTGLAFRGEGLNDNSTNGEEIGRNRLLFADADYLLHTLGIRTDLDLRGPREIASMTASPLGPSVRFASCPFFDYEGMFGPKGRAMTARAFRVFCDRANYPIYFHCIAGADRTGTLAYLVNGLLGVDKHDLEIDWESTFYPQLQEMYANWTPNYWQSFRHIDAGLAKYPGDTLAARIESYLLACGITPDEIAAVRAILLEPPST